MNYLWSDFDAGREALDILQVPKMFFTWQTLKDEPKLCFKNKTPSLYSAPKNPCGFVAELGRHRFYSQLSTCAQSANNLICSSSAKQSKWQ